MSRSRPSAPEPRVGAARLASPSVTLFLAMMAAQAALLVLSPILPDLAADLEVSTSTAAQLRSLSGAVAGAVALWLALVARARPLRDLIGAGLGLLALSSLGSALAPTFAVMAAAQLTLGVGLGLVASAALAAAGQWEPQRQGPVLSWALAGQPAAWILGMPMAGLIAEVSWRATWVAVPGLMAVLALGALWRRPRDPADISTVDEPSLWSHAGTRTWATGELLAYGGWAGTLVFAGALLIDSYGTSTTVVGLVLAGVAAAYLPGNFLARRHLGTQARTMLVLGGGASALGVAMLGAVRPGPWFSGLVLAAMALVAGARTLAASSRGLDLAPTCRLASMGVRTAAVQLGYLLGSAVGGLALATGGYGALGSALAGLYLASALLHAQGTGRDRGRRPPVEA